MYTIKVLAFFQETGGWQSVRVFCLLACHPRENSEITQAYDTTARKFWRIAADPSGALFFFGRCHSYFKPGPSLRVSPLCHVIK